MDIPIHEIGQMVEMEQPPSQNDMDRLQALQKLQGLLLLLTELNHTQRIKAQQEEKEFNKMSSLFATWK